MNRDQQYTKLYKLIQRCILTDQKLTCKQIESRIYNQQIFLNVLGSEPSFLTDLYCSIQLQIKNKNLQQQSGLTLLRDPFNDKQTQNYCIKDNKWHAFNCRSSFLPPTDPLNQPKLSQATDDTYSHPYHPKFYFKQDFKHLAAQKSKRSFFLPCYKIKITKWRIKIVNIYKGWYAPIIEAIDFKKHIQPNNQDFKQISLILYQKKVRTTMDRLRLQDLRAKKAKKFSYQQEQISLFYFVKDYINKKSNRQQNMFEIDFQKTKLMYDLKKTKYILFGWSQGTQGILTLSKPINIASIEEDRLKRMNIESLSILFSHVAVSKANQNESPQLWSSSDQSQEFQQNQIINPVIVSKRQESQDSEDEDPLRSLYLKQFKQIDLQKK